MTMHGGENKAVCFNCRFVEPGADLRTSARCPRCGYPLILNLASVSLDAQELERIFRVLHDPYTHRGVGVLPGISAPRKPRRMVPVKTPVPGTRTADPAPPATRSAAAGAPPSRATAQTRPDASPRTGRVLDARRPGRRRWLS